MSEHGGADHNKRAIRTSSNGKVTRARRVTLVHMSGVRQPAGRSLRRALAARTGDPSGTVTPTYLPTFRTASTCAI
jgi:hypothetical protein